MMSEGVSFTLSLVQLDYCVLIACLATLAEEQALTYYHHLKVVTVDVLTNKQTT